MGPLARVRGWRWRRMERRHGRELGGHRMPIQVCPRGCEYHEAARRDLLVRTRLSGRATMQVAHNFETDNCPRCGARLLRRCARCERELFAPIASLCRFCGLPQPWAAERRAGSERASLRLWDPTPEERTEVERRAYEPAIPLYDAKERGRLLVIEGDITQLRVDAIVSNDDVDGQMWAQVARAIKNAAGEGVERLAQEGKPFRLGYAWATSAGALGHLRSIIHVASMSRRGESQIAPVCVGLRAALKLADEREYRSIGIAAIGSGPASIDPHEWYREFAELAVRYLWARPEGNPLSIVLVLFEPADFAADVRVLQRAVWDVWTKFGRPRARRPKDEFASLGQRFARWLVPKPLPSEGDTDS